MVDATLPAYPTAPAPKTPPPKVTAAKPAAKPLSMTDAGEGFLKASAAQAEASQGVAEAERKAGEAKAGLETERGAYVEGLRQQEAKDLAGTDIGPFRPSHDTLGGVGALYMMAGMLGAFLGGKGTAAAGVQAQAALTGMLEGWNKGDLQQVAEQKAVYDENASYLRDKSSRIREMYREYKDDALKLGIPTAEGKLRQKLLIEAEADVNAKRVELAGATAGAKQAEDIFKLAEAMEQKRLQIADMHARQEEAFQQRVILEQMREGASQQGGRAMQQKFMAQRAINGLGGVASAVESLRELPAGTTTGFLPNLMTKDGMYNFIRNDLGRKLTKPEADMMNTLFTGIGRNLATIESSGTATGLQRLAEQMQSGVYIQAGVDDPYKVALKLADIRRIATENIRPAIDSGLLGEQQAKTADALVKRIEKAVPYTTLDVVRAYGDAVGAPKTIIDRTLEVIERSSHKATQPKEGDTSVSKSGKPIVYRHGQWEYL